MSWPKYSEKIKNNIIVNIPSKDFIEKYVTEYGTIETTQIPLIKLNDTSTDCIIVSRNDLGLGVLLGTMPQTCICLKDWVLISGEIVFNNVKEKCLKILERETNEKHELELFEYRRKKYLKPQKNLMESRRPSYWEQGNRHLKLNSNPRPK